MKALSIKQPWAWLICRGFKDIENRKWRIGRKPAPFYNADYHLQLPARIYVHASKLFDIEGLGWLTTNDKDTPNEFIGDIFDGDTSVYEMLMEKEIDEYPLGAIIGEVDIVDCVTKSESPWFVGPYGFVLKNPKLYENPIAIRGMVGFFEVNLPERTEIWRGLKVKQLIIFLMTPMLPREKP